MIKILVIAMIGAGLSACTIELQDGELQQELHPPLTYKAWNTERYKTLGGQPICAVTSGYSGLSVLLHRKEDDTIGVSVKGERKMTPGMAFSVNVNGNHYRTGQEYFSARQSVRIADDLSTDGKAYLEWSEPHGDNQGRLRSSNIVKLNDFKEKFEQCRHALLK